MKNVKFEIDDKIVENYVKAINCNTMRTNQIKNELAKLCEFKNNTHNTKHNDNIESIYTMYIALSKLMESYPRQQMKMTIQLIRNIIKINNGLINTRMIGPLNISRMCLSYLEKNNEIEKIERGMYVSKKTIPDDFYLFQQKYKKIIFSHMNALYFHGLTEELPYIFTATVLNGYHDNSVNNKCNVFYVDKAFYNLGLCEVKTPNGNIVRVYDIERCICDIIRSKNRMDFEQIKKSLREYVKRKDKNLTMLSKYAKAMGITDEVMGMVDMYL